MCQVHISPDTCHLSPVTCLLSPMPTARATDLPPANFAKCRAVLFANSEPYNKLFF